MAQTVKRHSVKNDSCIAVGSIVRNVLMNKTLIKLQPPGLCREGESTFITRLERHEWLQTKKMNGKIMKHEWLRTKNMNGSIVKIMLQCIYGNENCTTSNIHDQIPQNTSTISNVFKTSILWFGKIVTMKMILNTVYIRKMINTNVKWQKNIIKWIMWNTIMFNNTTGPLSKQLQLT